MALKFDINKVICINLKSFNETQLKSISNTYGLDIDTFEKKFSKIWLEVGESEWIIAVTHISNDDMHVCPQYCPITKRDRELLIKVKPLESIPAIVSPIVTKAKSLDIILDVDYILDKISAYGIDSLVKEEIEFLESVKSL